MTDLTLHVNKVITDRGISGLIPTLALIGAATIGFYTIVAIKKFTAKEIK